VTSQVTTSESPQAGEAHPTATLDGPLAGRVVALTGASRNLGLAITEALVDQGAMVVANFTRESEGMSALCERFPGQISPVMGDIGAEETAAAIAAAARALGRYDVLIHNAGIAKDAALVRMAVEDWDEVVRVNLRGAFLASKHALRPMMRQRYGRIIYISSVAAVLGNAGQASYSASKAGLHGLALTVSQEYADYGIRTAVVAPGLLDVGLGSAVPPKIREDKLSKTLLGAASSDEVVQTVAFLAGPYGDFINGDVIRLDGGVRT
jgi:3-oxoacyl-[acyl-carrier protein] reductase